LFSGNGLVVGKANHKEIARGPTEVVHCLRLGSASRKWSIG